MRTAVVLSLAMFSIVSAQAQETILWDGWMDITPCSRTVWYRDDFGIEWPTVEWAGQELRGEIYITQQLDEMALNRLKSCALQGVAAAGMSALLTNGAGAWPVFKAAFNACVAGDGILQALSDTISVKVDSHCRW